MIRLVVNETELQFEHSLVSLSDWEAEYEKPFFSTKDSDEKTTDEMMKYFEFMLISNSKNRHLIRLLEEDQKLALVSYINKNSTATTVTEMTKQKGGRGENVTSELIYYWLVSFKIPFKPVDEWHLNRLLMLVKICGAKAAPQTKGRVNKKELAMSMREANEARRAQLGTKG